MWSSTQLSYASAGPDRETRAKPAKMNRFITSLVFRESFTLVAPVEEFEEVTHFSRLETRIRHGHPVLRDQVLRLRVAFLHFFGVEQPPRQPRVRVALGHALQVRPDLLAAAHRVAQDAFGLEGELALGGFGIVDRRAGLGCFLPVLRR